MKLFCETLSCTECLFSWEGFAHGYSRGHSLLTKNAQILFVADDLAYCFPDADNHEYVQLFREEGWRDLESCPKCGSRNLSPPACDQQSVAEVDCIHIDEHDLVEEDGAWSLTESGREKINSKTEVDNRLPAQSRNAPLDYKP